MKLDVSKCTTLTSALELAKCELRAHGVRDLSYEYRVGPDGYIRNDSISAATFSKGLMESSLRHGGLNAYPVSGDSENLTEFTTTELKQIYNNKADEKYHQHPFIGNLIKQEYQYALSFTLNNVEPVGFAAMTVFPQPGILPKNLNPEIFQQAASDLHTALKESGLIGRSFNLSRKEILSLHGMSAGQTALDIASQDDVTVRTIELRLASARRKLNAKTTTEAVFKAVNYGILGREPCLTS